MQLRSSICGFLLLAACAGKGGGGGDGGGGPPSGWTAGFGGMMGATTDGTNFIARPQPTSSDLYSLVCVGHQFGWAGGAAGTLVATTNGGDTRTRQSGPRSVA